MPTGIYERTEKHRNINASHWRGGKIEKPCLFCGINFSDYPSHIDKRFFCSKNCFYKSRPIKLFCKYCGKEFFTYKTRVEKYNSKYCSLLCRIESNKKENHYNWRGGISPLNIVLRNCKQGLDWKNEVFKKNNYTCQICGNRGSDLNAHHIRKFSEFPELRYNLDNGATLCVDCHKDIHIKQIDSIDKKLDILLTKQREDRGEGK